MMSFLASIRALYLPRGFFLGWAPGRSFGPSIGLLQVVIHHAHHLRAFDSLTWAYMLLCQGLEGHILKAQEKQSS